MKKYLFFVSHLYSFSIVRPLQKVIKARGDEVAWFLNQPSYKKYLSTDEKLLKTAEEVMEYDPSAVFVASNNVPDFFPGIKVQLFHGFNAQKRNENKGHFRIRGFFDLYCTQGPSTTIPFEELALKHRHFEIKETGWTKMDPLFESDDPYLKSNSPIILFTSTFTPKLSAAHHLAELIKQLAEQESWQWLVTLHPKMDAEIVATFKAMENDKLKFVETDNIIPLLKSADVMLSDTSSVISEFLLQKKPVVTFNNRAPGPHLINVTEANDIKAAIELALQKPASLIEAIDEYVKYIHPYTDGKSALRVLDATDSLVARGRGHLKSKPMNLFRRFKARKRLGFFKSK